MAISLSCCLQQEVNMSSQYMPLVMAVLVPLYALIVYCLVRPMASRKGLMDGKTFEGISTSLWGPRWVWVLLTFRIGGVLFFSVGAFGIHLMLMGSKQFTDWNVVLIMWYYFFAALCTVLKYLSEQDNFFQKLAVTFMEKYGETIGNVLGTMFVVMASSALFITVVDFAILDQSLTFGNLAIHFFNSVFALCELTLNSVLIRKSDIMFVLGWVYIFMIHVWIAVAFGADYPYEFLECGGPTAVFIYLTLLIVCTVFFIVLWKFSYFLKERAIDNTEDLAIEGDKVIENTLSQSLV